jgi:hypothetical protein
MRKVFRILGLAICAGMAFLLIVFGTPRAMSPNSLGQVRDQQVSQEEANVALTLSVSNVIDSLTGWVRVEQLKGLATSFGILVSSLLFLSVALGVFALSFKVFVWAFSSKPFLDIYNHDNPGN